jgi:hypothetical protein
MTSSGYGADPQAIGTAAKAFEAQVDPIAQQAQKLDEILGSSSTTGRDYSAQGSAYHDAVTTTLGKLVREYSAKTAWVSGALSQTQTDYTASDQSGSSGVNAAGSGAN